MHNSPRTATVTATTSLSDLAEDWLISLEAEGKSRATLAAYGQATTAFVAWHREQGTAEPQLDRATATAFLADLRRNGSRPATARLRYTALRQFSKWLVTEGETDTDVLAGLRPPKLDKPNVPSLSDDELRRLIAACKGTEYLDVRDMALVRLMAETGLRAAEVLNLTVDDVDVRAGVVEVRRGKGGKARYASFQAQTATALTRYLRARRRHPLAHRPDLWLSASGRPSFGYPGLSCALRARARKAGIDGFHAHRLRHSAASRWLEAGGTEQGLMSQFGWSSRSMLDRYTSDTSAARALAEAKRLNLGNI